MNLIKYIVRLFKSKGVKPQEPSLEINKKKEQQEREQKPKSHPSKPPTPPYIARKSMMINYFLAEYHRMIANKKYKIPRNIRAQNPPGYKLHKHQREGARFLLYHKRGLLWHSPGSGKTVTSLAALYTLHKNEPELPVQLIVITTARTVPMWNKELKILRPHIQSPLISSVISYNYAGNNPKSPLTPLRNAKRVVIIDEGHHIKGRKQWWAAIYKIIKEFSPEYVFILTATPIKTNADEIYLHAILFPNTANSVIEKADTYLTIRGNRIRGTSSVLRKEIMNRTHVYFHKPLFEAINMYYIKLNKKAKFENFVMKLHSQGKTPIIYVETVKKGKQIARLLRNEGLKVEEIMVSYPKIIEKADVYVMTYHMGEGVNMQHLADTIVFADLPYGVEVLLQNMFRVVRLNSDLNQKYEVFVILGPKDKNSSNDILIQKYFNQIKYWFDFNTHNYIDPKPLNSLL